jgi:hypothetical protein
MSSVADGDMTDSNLVGNALLVPNKFNFTYFYKEKLDLIVHEDPALRETLNKPVMGKLVLIKEEALL